MRAKILTLALTSFAAACGGEPDAGQSSTEQSVAPTPSADRAIADRSCWSDRDCRQGQICRGARICPPGALCGPLPDQPGTCVAAGCDFEGQHYPPGAIFGPCDACECQSDGTVICQDFACLSCETDRDCPEGYACISSCPPGALCGAMAPEAYCMPVEPDPSSTECTPEECGPAPALPNMLCPDGIHYSGPGDCVRGDDGQCGWEILQCPSCSDTGCAAGEICLRTISGAPGPSVDERCIEASRYLVCDEAPSSDDAAGSSSLSCGCLDLRSICPAVPVCEEPDGKLIVTCTYR